MKDVSSFIFDAEAGQITGPVGAAGETVFADEVKPGNRIRRRKCYLTREEYSVSGEACYSCIVIQDPVPYYTKP